MQQASDSRIDRTGSEEEVYVAGVLVHALPARMEAIRAWIGSLPGAMVHGANAGKLVVTLEADGTKGLLDRLDALRAQPGVVSALPVYQHNEPAAGIDLEESHGN